MSMTKQINQLIEQIKLDLNQYQSQLSEIEVDSEREKEQLLEAIKAEEKEIKSLLSEYHQLKQKNEIETFRSSLKSLNKFKQDLLEKIKIASSQEPTLEGEEAPKKPNPLTEDKDSEIEKKDNENQPTKLQSESEREKTIAKLILFINKTNYQNLVKLYPANIIQAVPGFDFTDTVIRDKLLEHYRQSEPKVYQALVKLYQKPLIQQKIKIPNAQQLQEQDKKYHDFLVVYYPNALPFFWYLVEREPESIRYLVMECTKDRIIYTNEIEPENHPHQLNFNFSELLAMNNGASMEVFLRDMFICFHPQRFTADLQARNKYFDYINDTILKGATLEHSEVLKFWNQINNMGYKTVAAKDFPVKLSDN